jgi:hypothetical protein
MGSLFRRGNIWWVKYYQNGRPIRESTGATKETEAKRFLKEREGRVATGQPVLRRADRISYEEVVKDLREHYQTTGLRNMEEAEYRLICSRILEAHTGGRGFRTLKKPGKLHVSRQVVLGCYGMTSDAPQCGTWSTEMCLSG